jgi:hypothetical protein
MSLTQILNVQQTPLKWVVPNPATERIEFVDVRIDFYPGWMPGRSPVGDELYYFPRGVFVHSGYFEANQYRVVPPGQQCHFYWNRVMASPDSNFVNIWFNVGLKVSCWVSYS